MVKKRERLEVIHDILVTVKDSGNDIKPTRLLYASNLSPQMFKEYLSELIEKKFIVENQQDGNRRTYSITEKGYEFLNEYKTITKFIQNFGL